MGQTGKMCPGLEYVAIHIRNILQMLTSSREILCFGNTGGSAVIGTNRWIIFWISNLVAPNAEESAASTTSTQPHDVGWSLQAI